MAGTMIWNWNSEDVIFNDDEPMPSIAFSMRVHEQLIKPWKNSVVVKLLGRHIGYRALCNRLELMWSLTPCFSIIDLENDFYLIRFMNKGDADYALTYGLWTIMGHYLTVHPWSPLFDSSKGEIDKVVAWVRLPGMALHYSHKKIPRRLGQIIGSVIRIVYNTESAQQGKFAIALEIDLRKPLVSQFNLDGKMQKVEYESLPVICFQCGKYGHTKESRPDRDNFEHNAADSPILDNLAEKHLMIKTGEETRKEPKLGPWMFVARNRKPRVEKERISNQETEREYRGKYEKESRFNVLANLDDEDPYPERIQEVHMEQNTCDYQTTNLGPNLLAKSRHPRKKNVKQFAKAKFPEHVGMLTRLPETISHAENTNVQTFIPIRVLRDRTNLHANHANPNPLPLPT